jgi:hypothetical protein
MPSVLRRAAAVVLALAVAMIVITLAEALSGRLYPPPATLDLGNVEQMRVYIAQLPVAALLLVLAGYGIAALAGGWVAERMAKPSAPQPSIAIAAVLLGGSIMNLRAIPHPLWFSVANLLLVATLPFVGARLGRTVAPG